MESLCRTCGTTRPMISWTRYHTGVLAQRAAEGLKDMYYYWYYRPTLLSHSTPVSIMSRMRVTEDGSFFFDGEAQRNYVKEALVGAHHLMLYVIDTQNDHFKLGLDEEIRERSRDFNACWAKGGGEAAATPEAETAAVLAEPPLPREPPKGGGSEVF